MIKPCKRRGFERLCGAGRSSVDLVEGFGFEVGLSEQMSLKISLFVVRPTMTKHYNEIPANSRSGPPLLS